jgi:hypothetical protein
MTTQKKPLQGQSASQEEWLSLEDEQLKEVTGDGDPLLRTIFVQTKEVIDRSPRSVDPALHARLRQVGIDPEKVPANHSFKVALDGQGLIRYIQTVSQVASHMR